MTTIKRIAIIISMLLAAVFTISAIGGRENGTNAALGRPMTDQGTAASADVIQVSGPVYSADDMFSSRDLRQSADLSGAKYVNLESGKTITITEAGVYVLRGSVQNSTVTVEASKDDKVQLVLDGVSVTNKDFPCIYVKSADKVFVTTTKSTNSLSVTGEFVPDGSTNTDAVIFSKDDLVINGTGSLSISSTDNGITSKDDLKITGGTISINCVSDALEANDSIRIAGGDITIVTKKDGLHAEYDEDNSKGYIYISGGSLDITASDDGIHATTVVQIDGGDMKITAKEGIEGTYVQINGGTISISASDDGINGARKSTCYAVTIEINDGDITIRMGAGDTDGIDSNGNLYVNGGTIDITGNSPFDYDGTSQYTGGTIIVNGVTTNAITNQMMGGGKGGFGWGVSGTQGFPRGRF